jgi:hypothetical protein
MPDVPAASRGWPPCFPASGSTWFHGVLAPNAKLRAQGASRRQDGGGTAGPKSHAVGPADRHRWARIT